MLLLLVLFPLFLVAVFQLFPEIHSLLLFLEFELFLFRGFESGDGEGGLFFFRRHFGEARSDLRHLLQLGLHEFSLDVVDLDGQLVDIGVLLDESVFEVDGVDECLPHLLVQLDASVLQRSGIQTVDVKGRHLRFEEVIFGLLFQLLLTLEVILSAFQDQDPQLLLLVGGQLKFLLFSHSGLVKV